MLAVVAGLGFPALAEQVVRVVVVLAAVIHQHKELLERLTLAVVVAAENKVRLVMQAAAV